MSFDFEELGIRPNRNHGNEKLRCPKCPDHRKNDKPLSINHEEGVYKCHHCDWSGKARRRGEKFSKPFTLRPRDTKPKKYRKPTFEIQPATDRTLEWFATRGISAEVVRRNKIETVDHFRPDKKRDERCIAFPYIRDGQVINVQYRFADKTFAVEKDCEMIFYGLDDIVEGEPLYFVEGQIDKLSLEEAGFRNCISVPNGGKFKEEAEWLVSAAEKLDLPSRYILAGDNDPVGVEAMAELGRRLGVEKCWRVVWPEGCKDANDVLVKFGAEVLRECLLSAKQLPVEGLHSVSDYEDEACNLFLNGAAYGLDLPWPEVANLYKPRKGEVIIITGTPGTGKTSFLDDLMMILAERHQWRTGMFSAEAGSTASHLLRLAHIHVGKVPDPHQPYGMSRQEFAEAMEFLNNHIFPIEPIFGEGTCEGVLTLARAAVVRYGIDALLIDPWNRLQSIRPVGMNETDYISLSLQRIQEFAKAMNVHVWITVHPAKMAKGADGKYPVVDIYNLAGSARWADHADGILSLRRIDDFTELHVKKMRFLESGQVGEAGLYWDFRTRRFSERKIEYPPTENRGARPRANEPDLGEFAVEPEDERNESRTDLPF